MSGSDFWLTPAAPGTVAPAHLDKLRELHGVVRRWIEASAREQDIRINANLPYVDLMFAFGFATLGDHTTANKLVEDARMVMEAPAPPQRDPQKDPDPAVVELVRRFLFKAFRSRVEQAANGQPHTGPLQTEIRAELEAIERIADRRINTVHNLTRYIITRCREEVRVLEPSTLVDVYARCWTKHSDALTKAIVELHTEYRTDQLTARIRDLVQNGFPKRSLADVQFRVIFESLVLSDRFESAFLEELVGWVPNAIVSVDGNAFGPALPWKQGEMLSLAMSTAVRAGRKDLLVKLVGAITSLLQGKSVEDRFVLTSVALPGCLRSLKSLGLRPEIDRLLPTLENVVFQKLRLTEWRQKYQDRPKQRAVMLMACRSLAVAWCHVGEIERTQTAIAEMRAELADSESSVESQHYTEIACSYLRAFGDGVPGGLDAITVLFSLVSPARITNTFTTCHHFSRLHIRLVDAAVLAACRWCLDNPIPVTVTA